MKAKRAWISLVLIALLALSLTACFQEPDDPWTNSDGTPIVCRRVDCGQKPVYPDWERRFCQVHIQDTHSCRHPDCYNQIPNDSGDRYCPEHAE